LGKTGYTKEIDLPEEGNLDWGPLSALADVQEVGGDVVNMMSYLFADYEPGYEDGQRAVFLLASSIQRGGTGSSDFDAVIRETYLGFTDRPHAQWEIEINFEDAARIADTLVGSRDRPDTQIAGSKFLEILVRNDTTHSILVPPQGERVVIEFEADGRRFTATVGPPTVELLIRCALRREGLDRLAVFDGDQLHSFLQDQENRRSLAEGSVARISALRLLKVMAQPGLISLRIAAEQNVPLKELEQLATAYRVRVAYETSIVYAPVLDVNRLDGVLRQPALVRQLGARSSDFVEKIGSGETGGLMGDVLLGSPANVDEELSFRYLRAVSAGDPFSAFMSYYHVLEHDMNEAWFDNLRKKVEAAGGVLARPTDSIRRAATEAARFLGARTEDLGYTELRALTAVVDGLDIDTFTRDLGCHLDGALEYFANGHLPFVEVDNLNFLAAVTDAAHADIAQKIAKRIYAVRSAITHSKASGARYSPYTDDLYLGREIPLVRIAAEQLLIPADRRI